MLKVSFLTPNNFFFFNHSLDNSPPPKPTVEDLQNKEIYIRGLFQSKMTYTSPPSIEFKYVKGSDEYDFTSTFIS